MLRHLDFGWVSSSQGDGLQEKVHPLELETMTHTCATQIVYEVFQKCRVLNPTTVILGNSMKKTISLDNNTPKEG